MTTKEQNHIKEIADMARSNRDKIASIEKYHKQHAKDLKTIMEATETIVIGLKVMGGLKKLLLGTAAIVGSLVVIFGGFWAFAKFIASNVPK